MDKFYYIVAQLPALVFDEEPPISIEELLGEAEKWMLKHEYRALSRVDLETLAWTEEKNHRLDRTTVMRRFRTFEQQLRSGLAEWRKQRIDGEHTKLKGQIADFMTDGDPLEIEKKLLTYRWQYLDELEKGHDFDLDFLILYFLRLQILKRLAGFHQEEGMKVFLSVLDKDLWSEDEKEAEVKPDGEEIDPDGHGQDG